MTKVTKPLAGVKQHKIDLTYINWLKETRRSGSILVGSSIKELLLKLKQISNE